MGGQRSERRERACNRYVRRGIALLGTLLIGITVTSATRATEQPDDGFLEFLGSVDSEDKDWHDYLARTDIDKVARRAGPGNGASGNNASGNNATPGNSAGSPAANSPPASHPAPVDPPSDAGKTVAPP
jgi:hypothetical protein